MGSPIANCLNCGLRFPALAIDAQDSLVRFEGIGTTCPRCGGAAQVVDGTYDFVGEVLTILSAPSISRAKVVRFREIAQVVQDGAVSAEQVQGEIAQLDGKLETVWKWANSNAGALGLLIAIITAFLMVYYEADASADAEAMQRESKRQTRAIERVYDELRRQNLERIPFTLVHSRKS